MPLYALTIFISAFLLFLLQLIAAKQILPWFGGSAAVWATCLVFFQVALLFGYAYSDWVISRFQAKRQAVVHTGLLILSLALLPIIPDASWKPGGAENPALRILLLLTVTVGLPYFLLSTTSPLLQAWFARTHPGTSPYRLFALSNLASMLALLSYPLAIEPWISTTLQAQIWSVLYAVFVILCGTVAWRGLQSASNPSSISPAQDTAHEPPPTPATHWLWAALAAMGSVLLLAVSNHLTQDVASIPLLWVLPLSIYLLTFILCFDGRGWYRRNLFMGSLGVLICVMAWWLADYRLNSGLLFQVSLFSIGLFISCMFCHGELNRLRPAPRYLTRFYLMISLGGAIGALLVGIVAPLIFSGVYELALGLSALAGLWLYQMRSSRRVYLAIGIGVLLFTTAAALFKITIFTDKAKLVTRNFYGVLRIHESNPGNIDHFRRTLTDGITIHGEQLPNGRYWRTPTTYYSQNSGIGRTLLALGQPGARVGIVGLGAGTIAAYGKPGDVYRFYEINPSVIQIANREFSYLPRSEAKIETVLGDARLNLEREPSQRFVVLVVDAFSSDAIPMHLITSEAISVYLKHLVPGGVLAFHVTNKSLNLAPVVQNLADAHGLKTAYIAEKREDNNLYPSKWMLLTRNQAFLDLNSIRAASTPVESRPDWRLWTDDFNNLVQVLK